MSFWLGDTVPLAVDITDEDGNSTTPASITCTISLPDGTTTSPTPVSPQLGRYTVDYIPAQAGTFGVRWTSTGPAGAFTDAFDVRPAAPTGVVSLADAKAYLNIRVDGFDDELRGFLSSAVERVERHLGEVLPRRTVSEVATASRYGGWVLLSSRPVISLTSVVGVDGVPVWNVVDLDVRGDLGVFTARVGPRLCGDLKVVYTAGQPIITAVQRDAVLMVLEEYWRTQRSRLGGRGTTMGGTAAAAQGDTGPAGVAPLERRLEDLLGPQPVGLA